MNQKETSPVWIKALPCSASHCSKAGKDSGYNLTQTRSRILPTSCKMRYACEKNNMRLVKDVTILWAIEQEEHRSANWYEYTA